MAKTMQQVGLTTIRYPYEALRAISADDDTALTATTMQLGLPSGVITKSNRAEIVIFGTNADGEGYTWGLYAQVQDGPAELMAIGSGNLGEIRVGDEANDFYSNDITITAQKWLGNINAVAADNVALYIAKLEFDCFGYEKIWLALTNNGTAKIGAMVRWI